MGGRDHCAVYGCQNARHRPENHVVMDHVKNLRWHTAVEKDRKVWERQIGRKNFKVTKWTVVCSNHFPAGYYSPEHCNIPTLYMKGYDEVTTPKMKRKDPSDRSPFTGLLPKKPRNVYRNGLDLDVDVPIQTPVINDHNYDQQDGDVSSRSTIKTFCSSCSSKNNKIIELMNRIATLENEVEMLKEENTSLKQKHFGIEEAFFLTIPDDYTQ